MEQGSATGAFRGRRIARFADFAFGLRNRFFPRADQARGAVAEAFERELAERLGLHWLAVAFGAGALIYFALPRSPFSAITGVPPGGR